MHPKLAEAQIEALKLLRPISPWHKIGDCTFKVSSVVGTKIEDCVNTHMLYVWGNGLSPQQRECIAHERFASKDKAQAAEQELLTCVREWNKTMQDYQGKIEAFIESLS